MNKTELNEKTSNYYSLIEEIYKQKDIDSYCQMFNQIIVLYEELSKYYESKFFGGFDTYRKIKKEFSNLERSVEHCITKIVTQEIQNNINLLVKDTEDENELKLKEYIKEIETKLSKSGISTQTINIILKRIENVYLLEQEKEILNREELIKAEKELQEKTNKKLAQRQKRKEYQEKRKNEVIKKEKEYWPFTIGEMENQYNVDYTIAHNCIKQLLDYKGLDLKEINLLLEHYYNVINRIFIVKKDVEKLKDFSLETINYKTEYVEKRILYFEKTDLAEFIKNFIIKYNDNILKSNMNYYRIIIPFIYLNENMYPNDYLIIYMKATGIYDDLYNISYSLFDKHKTNEDIIKELEDYVVVNEHKYNIDDNIEYLMPTETFNNYCSIRNSLNNLISFKDAGYSILFDPSIKLDKFSKAFENTIIDNIDFYCNIKTYEHVCDEFLNNYHQIINDYDTFKQKCLIEYSGLVDYYGKQILSIAKHYDLNAPIEISNNSNITINRNLNFDNMDGYEFEKYCCYLLNHNGFNDVLLTKTTGDQGVDIIATKDQIKYAIQCKCYSQDLGNTPIQEVSAGLKYYNCHVGVVITNRFFTESAIELAKANGILLWDRNKLISLSKNIK